MLGQRILTAVVLLALLLPALFSARAWPFPVFTLLLIAAAGWEWGRLNAASFGGSLVFGAVLAIAGALSIAAGWTGSGSSPGWWLPGVAWLVGGSLALRAGPTGWTQASRPLRWGLGLVMLWAAWLAMAQARAVGLNFLLSIFVLVWVADISAYAGGRAFGRRKLAPTISPGKSWEGVIAGLVGVGLLALAWTAADHRWQTDSASVFSQIVARFGWIGASLAIALLAAMSVVGDLFESLVKRAAGVKDSSRLLPGHGGVLDRVDALLPVFPLAVALTGF